MHASGGRDDLFESILNPKGAIMGKYLVGWLLGVPVFVLALIYLFVH